MLPTTAANSGAITPSGQPVSDREPAAGQNGKRHGRGRQKRVPVIPVRDGESQRVRHKGEFEQIRIAILGDRLAKELAVLHDIDKVAQPDNKAGDRDIDPAGSRIQRRPHLIKRRA